MAHHWHCTGIDADLLVKISSMPRDDPRCGDGTIAFALPALFEKFTRRPTFGMLFICHLGGADFATDLGIIMHELGHIIVRTSPRSNFSARFYVLLSPCDMYTKFYNRVQPDSQTSCWRLHPWHVFCLAVLELHAHTT